MPIRKNAFQNRPTPGLVSHPPSIHSFSSLFHLDLRAHTFRSDTTRALGLLDDYCTKLRRPEEQQLKTAIHRVMGIFQSNLFEALLAINASINFGAVGGRPSVSVENMAPEIDVIILQSIRCRLIWPVWAPLLKPVTADHIRHPSAIHPPSIHPSIHPSIQAWINPFVVPQKFGLSTYVNERCSCSALPGDEGRTRFTVSVFARRRSLLHRQEWAEGEPDLLRGAAWRGAGLQARAAAEITDSRGHRGQLQSERVDKPVVEGGRESLLWDKGGSGARVDPNLSRTLEKDVSVKERLAAVIHQSRLPSNRVLLSKAPCFHGKRLCNYRTLNH
ncbi:Disks large -like protein 1 [Takifugu flavidus]|uniref:Disks large-like protein 1 n=1 Tax=Takifugu flavidus TaxID=433684 RepID=A0A5C6P7R2_9TELE|nr:Disks large -like protein 1 [Takifugu flavidus]